MASTLPGPALAASRAALNAAIADQQVENGGESPTTPAIPEPNGGGESPEPGEIQEVDMQAQAEGIRTVFNDPTNFNVKVSTQDLRQGARPNRSHSILFIPLGRCGLTHPPPKAEIFPKRPSPHFPKLLCPRRRAQMLHMDGWRISNVSSRLIVLRSFGGK